jgi:hypothetical protein
MSWSDLRLQRSRNTAGDLVVRFEAALLDAYLEFLAVRSRPNTVVAVAYDLKVFFTAVGKPPTTRCCCPGRTAGPWTGTPSPG